MNRLQTWLTDHKWRLPTKIFWICFLLFESILLLLGFIYYRHSSATVLNAQTGYSRQLIQKSDQYLQLSLTNAQNFFLAVSNDPRFQQNSFEELKYWLSDNLIQYMPNAKHIHVLENEEVVASTTPYPWFVMDNSGFRDQLALVSADRRLYWSQPYFSTVSQYTMSAMMRIPGIPDQRKTLVIDLDLERFYEALFPDKTSPLQGELLLLDRKNEIVFGRPPYAKFDVFQRRFVPAGLPDVPLSSNWTSMQVSDSNTGKQLFLSRSQGNMMGWQLLWIMDQSELLKPIRKSLGYLWMLAALSLLLTIGISVIVSVYVSKPIMNIAASMSRLGISGLHLSVASTRQDELGLLAKHFNMMTARIRQLVAELKRTEKEKQQLDFKALYNQIRPHFLYNTLNMIGAAAKQGRMQAVDRLIDSLTAQLQYSLDSSPMPVTLREELNAAQSYIRLMEVRYENRISLETDIDPDTLDLLIPKFVLQPLLENSVFHGLVPQDVPGIVHISTSLEREHWEIYMEDNGVGMTSDKLNNLRGRIEAALHRESNSSVGTDADHSRGPINRSFSDGQADVGTQDESALEEQLEGLPEGLHERSTLPDSAKAAANENERTSSGIGVVNVYRRLHYSFGDTFHMDISSEAGAGTRITIRLPLITNSSSLLGGE
jgi:sensor histidine kinase YesM